MKNLVKLILTIFFVLFSIQNYAQSLIIKGGYNLSDMTISGYDELINAEIKPVSGFHLGVSTEIPMSKYIFFEPGLLLSTKGAKANESYMGYSMESELYLLYLDIPLYFKVIYPLNEDFSVFASAGPYAGIGLYGLAILTFKDGNTEDSEDSVISWGSDEEEDDIRRFDTGLSFGAGLEYKSVIFGVYYDLGLSNNAVNRDNGMSMKNKVWKFGLAYRF